MKIQSMRYFSDTFDVQGGKSKYIEIYKEAINHRGVTRYHFKNLVFQLKTIYSFLKV